MKLSNHYFRLMRLHQPVGIWLLFWPCAWSLVLASGYADMWKLMLFFIGAVLMRGAGCVINDIADRNIDKHVERTKNRPLASGELNVRQAICFLLLLLAISLPVAVTLGRHVLMWGILALVPVVTYPFMKRISWWPQLFLGLVFNWGAFMGWAAVRGQIEFPAILLYIGGVFLTVGYDTIYAIQDKADDVRVGVRSTVIRLGDNVKTFVAAMYLSAIICFIIAAGNIYGVLALIPAFFHCLWQVYSLDVVSKESAKMIFRSNVWLEFMIFLALFISVLPK